MFQQDLDPVGGSLALSADGALTRGRREVG